MTSERDSARDRTTYGHLIWQGELAPLESIPFHEAHPQIERTAWRGFPVHLAVHRIRALEDMPEHYVMPHRHDHAEVNIIMSDSALVYDIMLEDERHEISAPCAIWIPPSLVHAANVIRGSGYFVCMILTDVYRATEPPHRA